MSYDRLVEKWAPVLNEESAGSIKDKYVKNVTAQLLENQAYQYAAPQIQSHAEP